MPKPAFEKKLNFIINTMRKNLNKTLKDFSIINKVSDKERIELSDYLFNKGCRNIYLLHSIYCKNEKYAYIMPDETFQSYENFSFFAAYNRVSGELHFFNLKNEGIDDFSFYLKITDNLKKVGNGIQYLGTNTETAKMLFLNNPKLYACALDVNDYYVYNLDYNTFINNLDNIQINPEYESQVYLKMPASRHDIAELIDLQKGYLHEEMHYPIYILSDKFVFQNLMKIYSNFKLFYLTFQDQILSKCEWNAFTDKYFQIGGVYTDQSYRKKGYGLFLLYKMLNYSFRNLNMKNASLFVRMTNEKAIKLYEKIFFKKDESNLTWAIFKN